MQIGVAKILGKDNSKEWGTQNNAMSRAEQKMFLIVAPHVTLLGTLVANEVNKNLSIFFGQEGSSCSTCPVIATWLGKIGLLHEFRHKKRIL